MIAFLAGMKNRIMQGALWGSIIYWALAWLSFLLFGLVGCAGAEIDVCYEHPVYGQVCVGYNGHVFLKATLDDAARAAVIDWLKSRGVKATE